jgi:hypothetical protein
MVNNGIEKNIIKKRLSHLAFVIKSIIQGEVGFTGNSVPHVPLQAIRPCAARNVINLV